MSTTNTANYLFDEPSPAAQAPSLPEDWTQESLLDALRRVHERLTALEELAEPLQFLKPNLWLGEHDARRLREVLDSLTRLRRHYWHMGRLVDARRGYPPSFDLLHRSLRDCRAAAAVSSWRYGEQELARQPATRREDYEAAIRNGVTHLQHFTTMQELTGDYYGDGYKQWVPLACGGQPDGRPLWHHIVREVAYWRRTQELVAGLPPWSDAAEGAGEAEGEADDEDPTP